ncbi:MAG: 50S ribosomal protein L17 [Candidatus Paceibacterota bacterium]
MRHHSSKKKFGLKRNQRNALVASLALSLILNEKIKTTEVKAKALRPVVEKLVSKGKTNSVASRRLLSARVGDEGAKKLVDVLGPKYKDRKGGYTRIVKLGTRPSDRASMAVIEFV